MRDHHAHSDDRWTFRPAVARGDDAATGAGAAAAVEGDAPPPCPRRGNEAPPCLGFGRARGETVRPRSWLGAKTRGATPRFASTRPRRGEVARLRRASSARHRIPALSGRRCARPRRRRRAAPVAVARLRPPARGVAVAPLGPRPRRVGAAPSRRARCVPRRTRTRRRSRSRRMTTTTRSSPPRTRRSTWTRRRTARAGEAGRFATSRASWWAPRAPRSRRTRTPSRASARPWTTTSSTCPP